MCGSFDIVYEAIIAQNDDNNARVDEDLQMDQIESVTASKCVKKLLRYEILVMRLNIEYHTYYSFIVVVEIMPKACQQSQDQKFWPYGVISIA